jgi:hypothetical protein
MDFLERLKNKTFTMDLTSLPLEDRLAIKKSFDDEKKNSKQLKLSAKMQKELENEINRLISKR